MMPSQSNPPVQTELLSGGNAVNVSLALYRQHFRSYLRVAAQSVLWCLVPIYGWAKASQLQALIARQAYSELIGQPETLAAVRQQLRFYTWDFWAIHLLVWLLSMSINFALSVASSILLLPLTLSIAALPENTTLFILVQLLQVVVWLITWAVLLWLYSRFMVAELPLAVEPKAHSWSAFTRSWQLTPKWNVRVQLAISSLFLVTMPLLAIAFFVPMLTAIAVIASVANDFPDSSASVGIFFLVFFSLLLLLFAVTTILAIPLWQALKAALYFDLLNRREGRDLQLRPLQDELPVPEPQDAPRGPAP